MRLAAPAFRITFAATVVWLGLPSALLFLNYSPLFKWWSVSVSDTAWAAVLYWLVGAGLLWRHRRDEYPDTIARAWWAAGCGFALIHAVVVFQMFGWSHTAAVAHTERASGFGAGVYVNYLFLAVWTSDVVWMCAAPRRYQRRPRWMVWPIHGFLAFVVFNAAVVFGTGAFQWVAAAGFGGLAGLMASDILRPGLPRPAGSTTPAMPT